MSQNDWKYVSTECYLFLKPKLSVIQYKHVKNERFAKNS